MEFLKKHQPELDELFAKKDFEGYKQLLKEIYAKNQNPGGFEAGTTITPASDLKPSASLDSALFDLDSKISLKRGFRGPLLGTIVSLLFLGMCMFYIFELLLRTPNPTSLENILHVIFVSFIFIINIIISWSFVESMIKPDIIMDKNGILYFVNFFSKDTILPWKNIIIIFLKKTPHKHSYSYNVIIYTDRQLKPTDSVFSDYKNIKEPDLAWLIEAYRKHHTEGRV